VLRWETVGAILDSPFATSRIAPQELAEAQDSPR
jgi:hypothetical protein